MEKVLAKLLLSQESRFVFLSNESLQVALTTTKSARVPNILFEIGSYAKWLKQETGCSATKMLIISHLLLHTPPETHCWSISKLP